MAYKVYHDALRKITVVEGTTETFPERSLVATNDGTNITIQTFGSGGIVLGPLPLTEFARIDGSTFTDMLSAFTYISLELNKVASGSDIQSEFKFISAQIEWPINHGFGFKPNVQTFDDLGFKIEACVRHIDLNNLVVSFINPTSGSATLT